jgi:hypothetical protein
MRLKQYLIIIAFLSSLIPLKAQDSNENIPYILEALFSRILNTNANDERLRLNDSVMLLIDSYAASDSVLKHKFKNVRNLGQIDSPDGKIKIINWNIALRDGSNKYFLYIIRYGGRKGENRIYKLTGESSAKPILTDFIYSPDNWYGSVYYGIQPFRSQKKNCYLLLGIDLGNTITTRKIIDVLSFDEKGEITFGRKCFLKGTEMMSREVLEYSSESVVSLRMQSGKMVVFDHLDSFSAGHGDSPDNVGAGLFVDGYILKKGTWNYTTNIEARNRK